MGVPKKTGGSKKIWVQQKNLGNSGGTKKIWVYKKKSKKNSSNIKEFPKYQIRLHQIRLHQIRLHQIRLHQIRLHQIEVHQIEVHQIGGPRFKFFGHIQSQDTQRVASHTLSSRQKYTIILTKKTSKQRYKNR